MPLKNKSMALVRIRRTPYSGLLSFLQDVFFKQESLAEKAISLLRIIYNGDIKTAEWRRLVKELFIVEELTSSDERVIDDACIKYLGLNRMDVTASKAKLRGRKAYKDLLGNGGLDNELRKVLERASRWNGAVASYYSVINKLKALGFIEKESGYYVKSDKFVNRLQQVVSFLEGFENEVKMQ